MAAVTAWGGACVGPSPDSHTNRLERIGKVGGIGVSGDSVVNDELVAKAGRDVFKQIHS